MSKQDSTETASKDAPKSKKGKETFQKGKFEVKIPTGFVGSSFPTDMDQDYSNIFKIARDMRTVIHNRYKDVIVREHQEQFTAGDFNAMVHMPIAYKLALNERKYRIGEDTFLTVIFDTPMEVPGPIHTMVEQIGYIEHEGIRHYISDTLNRAATHLAAFSARLGIQYSKTELEDLYRIRYNPETLNYTYEFNALNTIGDNYYATFVRELTRRIGTRQVVVNGIQVQVNADPAVFPIYGTQANRTRASFFNAYGNILTQAFNLTRAAAINMIDEAYAVTVPGTNPIGSAIENAIAGTITGTFTLQVVRTAARNYRRDLAFKMISMHNKIKMLETKSFVAEGTLAQFVRLGPGPDPAYYSTYALSAADAAFGLMFKISAAPTVSMPLRYVWPFREDIDTEIKRFIESGCISPTK